MMRHGAPIWDQSLARLQPLIASALAVIAGCSVKGREPGVAAAETRGEPRSVTDAKACLGHVFDLPLAPVLLDREGTLWMTLYPNGTVLSDGKIVGRLDSSGCFHDAVGRWVARWTSEGALIESQATSTFRLRSGTLEFLIDQTPYYVWTIEENSIVEHRTDFMADGPQAPRTQATIVGEADPRTRELALRLIALQTTRAKPSFFRDSSPDLP
jgi:hypothetical protein